MALQTKKAKSTRTRTSFSLSEILLYGFPVWLGALILGWILEGFLGLKSAIIGLLIISAYIAVEIFTAEKFKTIRDNKKAITVLVGGFIARILGLLVVTYMLYCFTTINLVVMLLTIVAGFTAMLIISTKNWINQ